MQLAALDGKYLMTEKQRTLWVKAAVAYLIFSPLTTISAPRLQTKIRTRDLPNTKQLRQSLTVDALSYLDYISHNQHHSTSSLLFSL